MAWSTASRFIRLFEIAISEAEVMGGTLNAYRNCKNRAIVPVLQSASWVSLLVLTLVSIAGCSHKSGDTQGGSAKVTVKSAELDSESIERGREIFQRATCQGCHPGGDNSSDPTKPLKGADFARKYPDDKSIENRVRSGAPNGMPSFDKSEITDDEMEDLISYIRSLTPSSKSSNSE